MQLTARQFQNRLLKWFDQHGRKTLPWQENKTPYRVWLSEIMLQQTQVATVIPYYAKFMQRFKSIADLAAADTDEVLHLWAGLGYYSRARNLHKAAQMVVNDFAGEFPDNLEDLMKLPGVGRSTAGAILSIAFEKRAPILDGNVKRVLSRYQGIDQPIDRKLENDMWDMALNLTPAKRSADYTQAIMDLGATLCTRTKPDCERCPFIKTCAAYDLNMVDKIPVKIAKKANPTRSATFLMILHKNTVFLQKRPATGIWGGLWSFPQIIGETDTKTIKEYVLTHLHAKTRKITKIPELLHIFSHYRLKMLPVIVEVAAQPKVMDSDHQIWYNLDQPQALGLPKPIATLMRKLP